MIKISEVLTEFRIPAGEQKVVYQFKGFTASQMDELHAMLHRAGIVTTPDFNKRTITTYSNRDAMKLKKNKTIQRFIKSKGGKQIKESKYTVHFDVGSAGLMSKTVDAKTPEEAEKKVASGLHGKYKIKKVVKEEVCLCEACQKGYMTHPTRKTKVMFGKRYRNCIKKEGKVDERKFNHKKVGDHYMGGENTPKGDTEMFADKKGRYYVWVKPKGKKEKYIDLPKNIKRGKADDLHLKIQKTMGESVNERMDKRQAGETLKQLGGNKFIAMTGAKQFSVGPKGMGFRIGRNAKSINYVRIDLKSTDLYDMEFIRIRGSKIKVVKKVTGVYNDQLQKMFTKYTGMYTSL